MLEIIIKVCSHLVATITTTLALVIPAGAFLWAQVVQAQTVLCCCC